MDAETHSHIFEPFFTTKPKGTGIGLGLSMVYGIVKQHQGTIEFMSEPGKGTLCRIYLPRISKTVESEEQKEPKGQLQLVGSETVLIVEDEDLVRKVAKRILEMHGYTVLAASDPKEAFGICEGHEGRIHLLLTDVVMPQMDGRTLFNRLRPIRKDMKVLYMSGYAEDAVVHHGTLDADIQFLQKPFTVESLAIKVREVLDAPLREQPPVEDVDRNDSPDQRDYP
jgi:CheY-like chemotaxis protein